MLAFGEKKQNGKDAKEQEMAKYMQAEINLLDSKLSDMEKIVSVGLPMTEMKIGIDKLDKVEQDLNLYKSNSLLMTSSLKKLGALLDTLYEDVKKRPTLDRVEVVSKRIDNLEGILAEFTGADSVKQLTALIELNRSLLHRVQNLEKIIEEELKIGVKPLHSKALEESQKKFAVEFKAEPVIEAKEFNSRPVIEVRSEPLQKKEKASIRQSQPISFLDKLLRKKVAKG